MKLWKYIKNEMLKNPNQIVCEDNLEMSYREIIRFAEDFSKKLKDQKCCAVMCESEFTAARILLACFAAGVTAVPVSARYGYKHCEKILETK